MFKLLNFTLKMSAINLRKECYCKRVVKDSLHGNKGGSRERLRGVSQKFCCLRNQLTRTGYSRHFMHDASIDLNF